jgi:hypothetical protein
VPSGIAPDTSRLLSIALAFLAGALAGAVVLTAAPGLLGSPTVATAPPDPDDPPTSVTTVGPSCYDGDVNPNAGWVHEVASGESYPVTLNATVVHDAGTEVRASVVPRSGNGYELALRTVEHTPERALDCDRVHTRLDMAVSLPTSYERLVVRMDSRELVSATREDTTADLYPLPNPIDATG